MPHFLVQWKFNPQSFETMRQKPLDRYATSVRLADAFHGSIVSMYNRMGAYDGMGIFSFPDVMHAAAHSVHALATGAFLKHECEQLLSPSEYKLALLMSHDTAADYLPPNQQDGA